MSTERNISFFSYPRKVWWRSIFFQVHLWVGLVIVLYACVIGVSGSIIVFEDELARAARPDLFRPVPSDDRAMREHLEAITTDIHKTFPGYRFTEIFFPIEAEPALQFEGFRRMAGQKDEFLNVYVDPATGQASSLTDAPPFFSSF